jgi:hypothetical protein
VTLADLQAFLADRTEHRQALAAIASYREHYGV